MLMLHMLQAYYGGEVRCEEQFGGMEDYDPKELVCGGCSDISRAQVGLLFFFLSLKEGWKFVKFASGAYSDIAQNLNVISFQIY